MDQPKSIKITDEKVALAKAEHFCAYQERAQQEVRDKLYEWGLWPDAVERIISQLIEGNFLNEERFARIYAKSKFNQKVWGRIKIKQGLKLKRVPDVLIKKALLTIDPDDYLAALTHLVQKKEATLTEKNHLKRRYKLQQYAMGRGFEAELIADILKNSKL
ncbi:regulatory protein [Mucilaginibacter sp. SG538B]|uniref:regulatory protein RecX n=1 Tax=Mucilaginibacter sp. SG538B TaxID=2587021 RepID=UPI00159E7666|nr:regulatory protein RecX [Mucilaginibacter sp. SG538B]NVM66774.1 regulatory protein [Mucilaginibacter sp. SG538B]